MPARFRLALLSGLFVLAAILFLPPDARSQGIPAGSISHITVIGRAHMEVVPDVATLSLAVVTEKPKAADAESANAAAAQALIQEIKAQGIDPRDIKTVSVTLVPVYDERRDLVRNLSTRVLRGYRARNSLMITVHDMKKASALAKELIGKGANEFYGIRFDYDRKSEAYDKLRGEAVKNALAEAKAYLAPLGITLGRVIAITPQENAVPRAGMPAYAALRAGAGPSTIPIEPGTQRLDVQVEVTWEINP